MVKSNVSFWFLGFRASKGIHFSLNYLLISRNVQTENQLNQTKPLAKVVNGVKAFFVTEEWRSLPSRIDTYSI